MKLTDLRPAKGAVKKRKRIGCGTGSGHGGTSTKGHKGHKARSGGGSHPWFEGGQMPLMRRLPKGGFKNPGRVEFQVVNVADLSVFAANTEITPALLLQHKLARRATQPIKLLGHGDIDRPLKVKIHAASSSALEKLKAAGGSVELLTSSSQGKD
ncbi:MAG: 50S ribosomal protein L15 [Candidatus Eisenbacteria bacterium]|nr:50S ribosomal protein L15 [Candidatus Eisenbacteria bacterium]